MGIKLTLEIVSPMDENDHELLSGCAVMVLAIANHELAKAKFPEASPDEEEEGETPVMKIPEPEPAPCGAKGKYGQVCVSKVGHRGQHKFRLTAANAGPVGTN